MDQGIPGVQSWSSRFVSDFSLALATNESVLTTIINDPRCTGTTCVTVLYTPTFTRSPMHVLSERAYCRKRSAYPDRAQEFGERRKERRRRAGIQVEGSR
eukprot:COSAG02_NODE_1021_length_15159_cov_24.514739_9_plen_100_part_00